MVYTRTKLRTLLSKRSRILRELKHRVTNRLWDSKGTSRLTTCKALHIVCNAFHLRPDFFRRLASGRPSPLRYRQFNTERLWQFEQKMPFHLENRLVSL